MARHGDRRAGRWLVQLRYKTGLTSEAYVSAQAWREATLERCPLHPQGGCSYGRHGTYARVRPPGTQVARWYCPEGHETISLLPDCLCARLSGALVELEAVVAHAEQAKSLEGAANAVRPDDIGLAGALRWTRRRRAHVHANLTTVKGLLPEHFTGCAPTVQAFRQRLGTDAVLVALRELAHAHLPMLSAPLGFVPPRRCGGGAKRKHQHQTGPDPPHAVR